METLEMTLSAGASVTREEFFEELYEKTLPIFARFAAKMNASFDDARDVFQDALVIYYERSSDRDFELRSSPEAYVLGIARHLWLKKFSHHRKAARLTDMDSEFNVPADYFPDAKEYSLLAFLEKSGERCMELLRKFYFEKSSLKTIASSLGYATEHSAAVQKFKCIGKLRDAVNAKSIEYEDFDF